MLPIAVNIFNKVQDTKLKSLRLSDFRATKDDNSSDISAALDKLELLLNDGRSPVLSAIKQTGKYSTEPLPDTLREYELSVKGGLKENPIDAGSYKRDNRRLKGLHAELSQIKTLHIEVNITIAERFPTLCPLKGKPQFFTPFWTRRRYTAYLNKSVKN